MTKIFGIGWAKTGTTTLGSCFKVLGFNHQSQNLDLATDIGKGNLSHILELVKTKETFEDWPWILLYKEFDKTFSDSRFILTKRQPEKWIRSYKNMLANQGDASEELNKIRRILYGLPFPGVSESQLIDRYNQHNADVENYFRDRPQDLLTVNWEEGDGWEKLCGFLGKDVPNEPLPHANKGKYARK
ncbi:MAG: sulfotransferase family protein [Leptolyngbyaceae cyanobacterium]